MRTEAEVKQALENVEREIVGIEYISCPSEKAAAYAQLPSKEGEVNAFKFVLEGSSVVFQWVDITHVQTFKDYLDHYHDQQDEALEEASNEHYQEWLETCEPGDEYVVSENDHSLDPYTPYFEVVHVDESEHGHHYQLTFITPSAATHFGLGWGKILGRLEAEGAIYPDALTPELDEVLGWPNFKCGHFAHVFQAAGYDIPKKAEREQAFILHWLTGLVLKHGAGWREQAGKELDALQDKVKQPE